MTQEQKDLLLKDLCARLPYGVMLSITHNEYTDETFNARISTIDYCNEVKVRYGFEEYEQAFSLEQIKPYLFPLSSMTEEQAKEMQEIVGSPKVACIMRKTGGLELWLDSVDTDPTIWLDTIFEVQDWLNKNHFDYHNLINKNIAIDCTNLNIY